MNQLELLNEFRELIVQLKLEVQSSSAMGMFDTHSISEYLIRDLFRELFSWDDLENLNLKGKNFPAIDLGSEKQRIGIQITGSNDLVKVKSTLSTFLENNLNTKYERVIIYILTEKQKSYSQNSIDEILDENFIFSAIDDIWDYRDLCEKVIETSPYSLIKANEIIKSYLRGVESGLADEDIDPTEKVQESVSLNLIELFFPNKIYIADISTEILPTGKNRRKIVNERKSIGNFCRKNEIRLPSAYVAHAGKLITFFDLENDNNPYRLVIEKGTSEPLNPDDFFGIDDDHEKVFKSLLRLSLQQRLFQERVYWNNDEGLFVFHPLNDKDDNREEYWVDKKQSKRAVFTRSYNKKDSQKVFSQKHFSFSVDFIFVDRNWFLAVTPDWFFSMGNDFKKSGFAHENISWLKRNETNRSVDSHFRFITSWLKRIDEDDLFNESRKEDKFLSYGEIVTLSGHPLLDEKIWEPIKEIIEEETGMDRLI